MINNYRNTESLLIYITGLIVLSGSIKILSFLMVKNEFMVSTTDQKIGIWEPLLLLYCMSNIIIEIMEFYTI